MNTDTLHALLPWYVNATLNKTELAIFERHLGECAACSGELQTLARMRAAIERHGDAFFGDHPAPEALAALAGIAGEKLALEEQTNLRRHLALCPTCAEESRWVAGEIVSTGKAELPDTVGEAAAAEVLRSAPLVEAPPVDSAIRATGELTRAWPPRARWIATAVTTVAAAAAVMLVTILLPGPWRGRPAAGVSFAVVISPTQRAADGFTVRIPAGRDLLTLLFDIDLPRDAFPAGLEILDARGTLVLRQERILATDLNGPMLPIVAPSALFPDGDYVARLGGSGPEAGIPTEYSFHVARVPAGG